MAGLGATTDPSCVSGNFLVGLPEFQYEWCAECIHNMYLDHRLDA